MAKDQVLILTVGGSPEPLIYSINEFEPDNLVFIHSPETFKGCSEILEETGFDSSKVKYSEISDAESLDESFSVAKSVFSDYGNFEEYDVRVDFTGGTKPMVSGIVLAVIEGNFSNFKFSYVGSKDSNSRNKRGVGVVKDGSEIVKMQINPYKKYAITEFKRGRNFFNTYQFEAALENFQSAKSRLEGNANQKKLAETYEKIVLFYQKWDLFEDKFSRNTNLYKYMNFIFSDICSDEFLADEFEGTEFMSQFMKNREFLSLKLRGVSYDKEDPAIKGLLKFRISYYLSDLLNNAYRRIEEAKYDDAVARLYRINELLAQVQLTKLGIIDDNELQTQKAFKVNIETLKDKAKSNGNYEDVSDFIYDNSSPNDRRKGKFTVANDRSFELLELFGIKQSDKFEKLNRDLKVRNFSILAHGLNPIGQKKANDLYEKTLDYVKDYFPDLENEMDMAKFPKF